MNPQKDNEVQPPEANKEAYLSRLPQADQINLRKICEQFKKIMNEEGRKGALVAVGGTLDKLLPRKDIDLIIVLQPHPADTQKGTSTEFDFAMKDFKIFRNIIEEMLKSDLSLQIQEVIEPAIDEEFNSPSILKTGGSITITSREKGSMPIEFVRKGGRGYYQPIVTQGKHPFVLLEEI